MRNLFPTTIEYRKILNGILLKNKVFKSTRKITSMQYINKPQILVKQMLPTECRFTKIINILSISVSILLKLSHK